MGTKQKAHGSKGHTSTHKENSLTTAWKIITAFQIADIVLRMYLKSMAGPI